MNAVTKTEKSLLKTISFRCYAELNDFLPLERKQRNFTLSLKIPVTVAEVIELLGIPLSEVDLVMVNSQPVERNHRLHENDYASIYPTFETFDISSLKTTQKQPLRITRFILDAHLGKLARYLRMLGFDTVLLSKSKEAIRNLIDPDIYRCFDEFFFCPVCNKVFWKGSHFERMEGLVLDIISRNKSDI